MGKDTINDSSRDLTQGHQTASFGKNLFGGEYFGWHFR